VQRHKKILFATSFKESKLAVNLIPRQLLKKEAFLLKIVFPDVELSPEGSRDDTV